ncbi:MAG: hypothetical protein IPJ55_17515 [Chloracidobacterium sp.]|nr:hypothetical protein [Chloracidobacterium sp.]
MPLAFRGSIHVLERRREEISVSGRSVYAHIGALGGLYLTKELADFLQRHANSTPFICVVSYLNPALPR